MVVCGSDQPMHVEVLEFQFLFFLVHLSVKRHVNCIGKLSGGEQATPYI